MKQGCMHLYWGEGKGKTTAAMGLALRALGRGRRVVILQFLKGSDTGEVPLLRQLGAQVLRTDEDGSVVIAATEDGLQCYTASGGLQADSAA